MMMAVSFTAVRPAVLPRPRARYSPKVGDQVLVPTDAGAEVAECVWAPQWVSEDIGGLPVCAGLADRRAPGPRRAQPARAGREARVAAKRLIREHELPMKVVGVDYLDADNVATTIYFTAPHRVDFRALVRDLAARPTARVELRQLGPRDEARLQGGIGPCGRDLCCSTFLKDFEPVSVRMAKDQDLPVNPLRISGRLRAADVLPEVRAPAVRRGAGSPASGRGRDPRRPRPRRRDQRAERDGEGSVA